LVSLVVVVQRAKFFSLVLEGYRPCFERGRLFETIVSFRYLEALACSQQRIRLSKEVPYCLPRRENPLLAAESLGVAAAGSRFSGTHLG